MQLSARTAVLSLISLALFATLFAQDAYGRIHTVNVSNNTFTPKKTAIAFGDTVQWIRQAGSVSHTSTSDPLSPKEWDSQFLTVNVSFRVQFTAADGNGPFPYHCDVHPTQMKDTIFIQSADVQLEGVDVLPSASRLDQNYPNPFNPTTTIQFSVDRITNVEFGVYNVIGEQVESQKFGELAPGTYSIKWDASMNSNLLPSGIYFYRLRAGNLVETRKMVLLK